MKENQLSRWGAIAKHIPLMNPGAKVFLVAKTALTFRGELDQEFPPDKDGDVRVVSTVLAATALCQASRGDVVLILPGHTESITTAIAMSVAGVRYIGIGSGNLTPAFTVAGAIDGFNITGANVEVENVRFTAPSVDSATAMINCNATGIKLKNIKGIGSGAALNFVDCITVVAGANDMEWENIKLVTGTLAVANFISIEGLISNFTAGYVTCIGSVSTAGITDSASSPIKNMDFHNFYIIVGGSSVAACTLDSASSNGVLRDSYFAGTVTTLASNCVTAGDVRRANVFVSEETGGGVSGATNPAIDTD